MGTWYLGEQAATHADEISALRYGLAHGLCLMPPKCMATDVRNNWSVRQFNLLREKTCMLCQSFAGNARPLERSLDASLRAFANRLFGFVSVSPARQHHTFGNGGNT